jgi:hypothetical protein
MPPDQSVPPDDKIAKLSLKTKQLYESQPGVFEKLDDDQHALGLRAKELQLLADTLLGERYDQAKVTAVIKFQQALQVEQRRLARELQEKRLAPPDYLNAVNAVLARVSRQCEEILGPDDFEKLFGVTAQETERLIDREIFLGTRQS